MEIPKLLAEEISEYCRVNDIINIDEFNIKLLKQGFTIEKFGATPRIIKKEALIPNDKEVNILKEEINNLSSELIRTKQDLEEEKKRKKDIYGEE